MREGFASAEDISMRLSDTFCLYKGKAVYVRVDAEAVKHKVWIGPPSKVSSKNPDTKLVDYRSDDFQYRYIKLGYMQHNNKAVYVVRLPERKMSEGVKWDGCYTDEFLGASAFFSKDFERCMEGRYLPIKAALTSITNRRKVSIPIHRDVAVGLIDDKIGLYYKSRLVGMKDHASNNFYLLNCREMTYLHRILSEIGVLR